MIISQETIDILKAGGICFGVFLLWFWSVLMFKVDSSELGEIGLMVMFIVPFSLLIAIGYTVFTNSPVVITIHHLILCVPSLILFVINCFVIRNVDHDT